LPWVQASLRTASWPLNGAQMAWVQATVGAWGTTGVLWTPGVLEQVGAPVKTDALGLLGTLGRAVDWEMEANSGIACADWQTGDCI